MDNYSQALYFLKRVGALVKARRKGGKVAAGASLLALLYATLIFRQARRPTVTCRRTSSNMRLLKAMAQVIYRPYYPSWLTPNTHVNSALGFFKRGPRLSKTREILRTWDGGSLAIDWRNRGAKEANLAADTPTLLVIHGLNGHSEEACVLYAMENAHRRGWRAVAMNHRSCGGSQLTSGWSYSLAFTGDIRLVVSHIRNRYPDAPIFAVGFSLGANLLVKYLGEEGKVGERPLAGAVVVSNPWVFNGSKVGGDSPPRGIKDYLVSRFYEILLMIGLKRALKEHMNNEAIKQRMDLDVPGALRATSFFNYDASVVVPMWGYKDVWDYREDGASRRYVMDVRCPLLCVNANDDPICPPSFFPLDEARCNPCVIFVQTQAGGHIGFGEGLNPFGRQSWADRLMSEYFEALMHQRNEVDAADAEADIQGDRREGSQGATLELRGSAPTAARL